MTKTMTADQATKLTAQLNRYGRRGTSFFRCRAHVEGDNIVFIAQNITEAGTRPGANNVSGGVHTLNITCSSRTRVLTHWEGFVATYGCYVPQLEDKVLFLRSCGRWEGKVVGCGHVAVKVKFRRRNGSIAHRTFRIDEVTPRGAALDRFLASRAKSL